MSRVVTVGTLLVIHGLEPLNLPDLGGGRRSVFRFAISRRSGEKWEEHTVVFDPNKDSLDTEITRLGSGDRVYPLTFS